MSRRLTYHCSFFYFFDKLWRYSLFPEVVPEESTGGELVCTLGKKKKMPSQLRVGRRLVYWMFKIRVLNDGRSKYHSKPRLPDELILYFLHKIQTFRELCFCLKPN